MGKKIKVKKCGYVYVFQMSNFSSHREREELRQRIKEEIEEGCVVLDGGIHLIDAKPSYKALRK